MTPSTPGSPPVSPGPLSPGGTPGKHICGHHLHTVGGPIEQDVCHRCRHKRWHFIKPTNKSREGRPRRQGEVTVLSVGRWVLGGLGLCDTAALLCGVVHLLNVACILPSLAWSCLLASVMFSGLNPAFFQQKKNSKRWLLWYQMWDVLIKVTNELLAVLGFSSNQ